MARLIRNGTLGAALARLADAGLDVAATREAVTRAGLDSLPVRVNRRLRVAAGRATFDAGGTPVRIEFNWRLESEGADAVRQVVIHETAHALAGRRAGHGRRWQLLMLSLGARPDRCHDFASMERAQRGRVVAVCQRCGTTIKRARRLKRNAVYSHRNGCGGRVVPISPAEALKLERRADETTN